MCARLRQYIKVKMGTLTFTLKICFFFQITNRRKRRSAKKKLDVPLTEDMLNELNKGSMVPTGGGGYSGHHNQNQHHHNHQHHHFGGGGQNLAMTSGAGYDNYGHDTDELYDLDDVWNNDRYAFGQNRYKVRD